MPYRAAVATALAIIMLTLCPIGASAASDGDFADLDAFLDALASHDRMMLGVAVARGGAVVLQAQAGLASVEDGRPLAPETRFRIGSISKVYTAVLIMQLVEEGVLALETTLDAYYPAVANAERITLRQMLQHRSGIASFTDAPDYPTWMTEPMAPERLEAMVASYPSSFEPGSRYAYSNSNYWLLGRIAERAADKSYGELLAERITGPLKLTRTALGDAIDAADEARSYVAAEAGWRAAPETDLTIPLGAGALISTPAEVLRFLAALFGGELVGEASLAAMMDVRDGYGLGLMVFPYHDRRFYGHSGGIDGFITNAAWNPEDGTGMAVLANAVNMGRANFNDALIATLDAAYGKPVAIPDFSAEPVAVAVPAGRLAALEGTYASAQLPLEIRVFVEGGRLMGQATGQGAFPLAPFSQTEFRFEPAGIVMRWDAASLADGATPAFTLEQGGGRFDYTRKE